MERTLSLLKEIFQSTHASLVLENNVWAIKLMDCCCFLNLHLDPYSDSRSRRPSNTYPYGSGPYTAYYVIHLGFHTLMLYAFSTKMLGYSFSKSRVIPSIASSDFA